MWDLLYKYWEVTAVLATVFGPILTVCTILWVLSSRKESTSTVAWCLVLILLPFLGPIIFYILGYQHVSRPLSRKQRHRRWFHTTKADSRVDWTPAEPGADQEDRSVEPDPEWADFAKLAQRYGAAPMTSGNHLEHYEDGDPAFAAMLESIRNATKHIHLETFIFQPDDLGAMFREALAQQARSGVKVRVLFDAMGSLHLRPSFLRELEAAGGRVSAFLPISPLRRRIQVNMRNHRKLLIVDGRVGYIGGLNVGDEYRSRMPRFGFWRDSHLRLEGPVVSGLQQIFIEDWDFAAGENLSHQDYFPAQRRDGPYHLQIAQSGPDSSVKGIREIYFSAILQARQRVWIATPYFVPDSGLLDALCLAAHRGVDVRILGLYHPDKWIPYFAGRYYWDDVLRAGVKVYQYTKGMMHSKVVLVDGAWASVGSANLDNRSLHLNFEANCLIYAPPVVSELEEIFLNDLITAVRLDRHIFPARPWPSRLMDSAARLLSPIL
ncbi:MAG TPA: cardiolipin synthase [Gemmataceae bacterium]|jgi:cardiolipin synthase|nr:cardiolipin synthase [Gemmataceae bacterium]